MAAIRTVRESFRGDRSTILATSVALFGIVFALRLASPEAELGVTFLFVAPIVLVSLVYGARGAALGVAVAFGLTVLWAIVQHANLEPLGYLVRGIVFAFVGATSAIFRNQSRRLEEETTAWFEQALDLHCIADATGRFVRINEAFTRVLGHHKDEFQARLGSRRSTSPPARASTTYSTARTGQCSWRSGAAGRWSERKR